MARAAALAVRSRTLIPNPRRNAMPTIQIQMFDGRSKEQRQELARAITEATCRVMDLPPEAVDIVITEVKRENWITAGKPWG